MKSSRDSPGVIPKVIVSAPQTPQLLHQSHYNRYPSERSKHKYLDIEWPRRQLENNYFHNHPEGNRRSIRNPIYQQSTEDISNFGSRLTLEFPPSPDLRYDTRFLPEPPPTPENVYHSNRSSFKSDTKKELKLIPSLLSYLSSSELSLERTHEHKKKEYPKFFVGPPSVSEYLNQQHTYYSSGSASTPESQRVESRKMLPNQQTPEIHKTPRRGSLYHPYWYIPRATLWCSYKGCGYDKQCSQCQLNEDSSSMCSTIDPPPTFTALDNYRYITPKRRCKCKCGTIFFITTAFSIIMLLIIAAFVLYIEIVLKNQKSTTVYKM